MNLHVHLLLFSYVYVDEKIQKEQLKTQMLKANDSDIVFDMVNGE